MYMSLGGPLCMSTETLTIYLLRSKNYLQQLSTMQNIPKYKNTCFLPPLLWTLIQNLPRRAKRIRRGIRGIQMRSGLFFNWSLEATSILELVSTTCWLLLLMLEKRECFDRCSDFSEDERASVSEVPVCLAVTVLTAIITTEVVM